MEKKSRFLSKKRFFGEKIWMHPWKHLFTFQKNTCGSSSIESVCSVVTYITFINTNSRPITITTTTRSRVLNFETFFYCNSIRLESIFFLIERLNEEFFCAQVQKTEDDRSRPKLFEHILPRSWLILSNTGGSFSCVRQGVSNTFYWNKGDAVLVKKLLLSSICSPWIIFYL